MKRYDEAREAFEYLQIFADLDDQVELDSAREELMRNPTKSKAADMYEAGIRLWFGENRRKRSGAMPDDRVEEIADKYGEL